MTRSRTVLALVGVTAALLAGCSSSSKVSSASSASPPTNDLASLTTGREMLGASLTVAKKASSVQIVLVDEKPTASSRGNVDVTLARGKGAFGVVTLGDGIMQFISVPGKAWWRGDLKFWKGQGVPSNYKLLQGKWIAVTPKDPGFSDFLSYGDYARAIDTFAGAAGQLDVGPGTQVVWGVRSVVLATQSGGGIAVAADGPPLPVRVATSTGSTQFTNWNVPVEIIAPKPSTVVPYAAIKQTE